MQSNMGGVPEKPEAQLPRNIENKVRQEVKKESMRKRLRKLHEMRKVQEPQSTHLTARSKSEIFHRQKITNHLSSTCHDKCP